MKRFLIATLVVCSCSFAVGAAVLAADIQQGAAVIVVHAGGKEHTLQGWKFVSGTKNLSWLATLGAKPGKAPKQDPDKGDGKGTGKKGTGAAAPATGPEALDFTEGKSAPPVKHVQTFVLLSSVRRIDFDDKDLITLRVATSDKEVDDYVLYGLGGTKATNLFAIEATADPGDPGKGTLRFERGNGRGLQSIRFASPKPVAAMPAGRVATIKQAAKNQPSYDVVDLKVLYTMNSGLQLLGKNLYFKGSGTDLIELAKVKHFAPAGTSGEVDVTPTNGQKSLLVLNDRPKSHDGTTEIQLEGFVGRFPGGYRVFPMSTVGEITFEEKGK